MARPGTSVHHWDERATATGDLLVNATAIGMDATDPAPVDSTVIGAHDAVFDVVVSNQPTPLIDAAVSLGRRAADGFQMAFFQACDQFELYTGMAAPVRVMWEAAQTLRQAS